MDFASLTIAVCKSGRATRAANKSRTRRDAHTPAKMPGGSLSSPAVSSVVYGVSALPNRIGPAPGMELTSFINALHALAQNSA
eukprot:367069-Heterocapsa_arctica.AAC.1